MDAAKISAIVGLLVALSAASERMVEIVKGMIPWLNKTHDDASKEGWRKMSLQVLAVGAGILTTFLARPALPSDLIPASAGVMSVIALGFLASGGSGLWNSVLTYVLEAKNLKEKLADIAAENAAVAEKVRKSVTAGAQPTSAEAVSLESGTDMLAKLTAPVRPPR